MYMQLYQTYIIIVFNIFIVSRLPHNKIFRVPTDFFLHLAWLESLSYDYDVYFSNNNYNALLSCKNETENLPFSILLITWVEEIPLCCIIMVSS